MPRLFNRTSGILVPVFSLRHDEDLGIGDVRALEEFCLWAKRIGFGFVQILPVNETGNDPSPYNAISSKALDPLLLNLSPRTLPELPAAEFWPLVAQFEPEGLRSTDHVDYPRVRKAKRAILDAAFRNFEALPAGHDLVRSFEAFCKEHSGWIEDYALFRALMHYHGESERWDLWPEPLQRASTARVWLAAAEESQRKSLERAIRFFIYVQWRAFEQWADCKATCRMAGVRLMGDIPFGVGYYSADVFSQPELFDLEWSGGAPPEPWFKDDRFTQIWGQNWGIPLYRWDRMKEDGFAWWRDRVRTARHLMDAFRIDHILGFYRIYRFPWRPEQNEDFIDLSHHEAWLKAGERFPGFFPREDWPEEQGNLNRAEGEERLRAVLEAAGEECWVVGEDLGVVPDYMRPHMASLGIPGITIPMWTKGPDGRVLSGDHYPLQTMAMFGTHDHEPLHGLWARLQNEIAEENSGREADSERAQEARSVLENLVQFAGLSPETVTKEFSREVHEGLIRALLKSQAAIVLFMVTDLLRRTERFNVPGSVAAINWSCRLPWSAWQLARDPFTAAVVRNVPNFIKETNRE